MAKMPAFGLEKKEKERPPTLEQTPRILAFSAAAELAARPSGRN